MNKRDWSTLLLNGSLLLGSGVLILLLYGMGTRLMSPPISAVRVENPAELIGTVIQIEVRNGSGTAGLAEQATRFLRRRGFDVVASGNHSSFDSPHSVVLNRSGDGESARRVAESLGIPEHRVVEELDADLFLDASVIIGRDYETLTPFRK